MGGGLGEDGRSGGEGNKGGISGGGGFSGGIGGMFGETLVILIYDDCETSESHIFCISSVFSDCDLSKHIF